MKIKVTLNGTGGELDSRTVDSEEAINGAIGDMIEDCPLSPGDSITIEEVES